MRKVLSFSVAANVLAGFSLVSLQNSFLVGNGLHCLTYFFIWHSSEFDVQTTRLCHTYVCLGLYIVSLIFESFNLVFGVIQVWAVMPIIELT